MEIWLSEIKVRVRRKVGELSKELEKSKGGNNPNSTLTSGGKSKYESIKQTGLSISVAKRCEKIADILGEKFEAVIAEAKEKQKPITYADVEK